jgi:hypothetical protein
MEVLHNLTPSMQLKTSWFLGINGSSGGYYSKDTTFSANPMVQVDVEISTSASGKRWVKKVEDKK